MMDFLAHRDHSEVELRDKLHPHFTPEEIEKAIQYGQEKGWVPQSAEDSLELSEKTATTLRRKGKGAAYINNYLEKKGLPQLEFSPAEELEKAQELVKNKFSDPRFMDRKEKAKVGRFLISRGFDPEIARKVIYEPEDV